MPKLILRVRRGGRLLGSWSLGEEPLEMSVVDVLTGRELASFTAHGAGLGDIDEVPLATPVRLKGDDLTMPLPEPTDAGDLPSTEEVSIVRRVRKQAVRNLAHRLDSGRQPGDDFTVPHPEATVTTELPVKRRARKAVKEPETPARATRRAPVPPEEEPSVSVELSLDEVLAGVGESTDPDMSSPDVTLGDPESSTHEMGIDEDCPTDSNLSVRGPSDDRPTLAQDLREATQELHTGEIEPVEVPPAEVWVRQRNEWHAAGHLVPGQRVLDRGGWVRLGLDGRLVVCAGDRMDGSATLLDGRTVGIGMGQDAISLPPGASVLLRLGEHGLYVRSEPLPDTTGSVVYDTPVISRAAPAPRR